MTYDQVITALSRYRGEFYIVPGLFNPLIRHRSRKDANGVSMCPLCVLVEDLHGVRLANSNLVAVEDKLGLDKKDTLRIVSAADQTSHPSRKTLEDLLL